MSSVKIPTIILFLNSGLTLNVDSKFLYQIVELKSVLNIKHMVCTHGFPLQPPLL